MVQLNLIIALVFLGITIFMAAKNREWWLAGFAFVAGILLASSKVGITVISWVTGAAAWVVGLFQ
jgi:hypothetical protein